MSEYKDYLFRVNISTENYESKEDAVKCLSIYGAKALGREKMAFREQTVTTTEFLSLATSGHTFCALFDFDPNTQVWIETSQGKKHAMYPVYKKGKNAGAMKLCIKSDQFFRGSQVVFVDVDYTEYKDVSDYISVLRYPPTCVYMSFSDKKEKDGITSRRFRLVYVFDRLLNKEEFIKVSKSITQQIELDTHEPMQDKCGTRPSQYFNGVYGNNEVYQTDIIYQIWDIPEPMLPPQPISIPEAKEESQFDERMVADMKRMTYEEFMHYYSMRYRRIKRTESPFWLDDLYQLTDDSYLQTWYFRELVKDGEHRRRKIYKNICLRRLICADMDMDTALFNAYIDRHSYFDNGDGVLSIETLQRKVKKAFKLSRAELEDVCSWERFYWCTHRPEFILKSGVEEPQRKIKDVQRRINYANIDTKYDKTQAVQENFESGIGVSVRTLYRYVKDRGINSNPNKPKSVRELQEEKRIKKQQAISTFRRLYNPALTLRQNLDIMRENGFNISSPTTIKKWKERYIDTKEQTITTPSSSFPLSPSTLPPIPPFSSSFPSSPISSSPTPPTQPSSPSLSPTSPTPSSSSSFSPPSSPTLPSSPFDIPDIGVSVPKIDWWWGWSYPGVS